MVLVRSKFRCPCHLIQKIIFIFFCISSLWLFGGSESGLYLNERQLTFTGLRSGEGYFSQDDGFLVYQSEKIGSNPFYQIYLIDLFTGETNLVSSKVGKATCAWIHPDNKRILFASTYLDPLSKQKQKQELKARKNNFQKKYSWDYDENYDLFLKDIETGVIERITETKGYDAEGAISPDGKYVIFSSNRNLYKSKGSNLSKKQDSSYYCDIYLHELENNLTKQLTFKKGYDGGPFFNNDGSQICWRRFSENGHQSEIFTMDLEIKKENKITELGAMSWAPFFHPSDDYIIFSTNLHGFDNFELYIVDRCGRGQPIRVTNREGFDGLPSFSNDGKTLTWTSNKTSTGKSQIFTADWNHETALKLLSESFSEENVDLEYSPSKNVSAFDLSYYINKLAKEEFNGRMTGSIGMNKASSFVAQQFNNFGLVPFEERNWRQNFSFLKKFSYGKQCSLKFNQKSDLKITIEKDWIPMNFSENCDLNIANATFVGYGLKAESQNNSFKYDSYTHIDVKDKWVIALSGYPDKFDDSSIVRNSSGFAHKASTARNLGATGIIFINTDSNRTLRQTSETFDHSLTIKSFMISYDLAKSIFHRNNINLNSLVKKYNEAEKFEIGHILNKVDLSGKIYINKEKGSCANTIGLIPTTIHKDKFLVVGAHLDHLGTNSTFSRKKNNEKRAFHPGADDNLSGVAALLEIAQKLSYMVQTGQLKPRLNILFACWSGEEIGLLGSSYFVKHWFNETNPKKIVAYLNMDMVGRYTNELTIHGTGSSREWENYIQRANMPLHLNLNLQKDSFIPTDSTSFITRKIPIISAFTGLHNDYHLPSDTPDKINFQALRQCSELFYNIVKGLNKDCKLEFVPQQAPKSSRAKLRVYLGTIPNYGTTDTKGVVLSGVTSNGPANKAGLKSGDIIIGLNGEKIESIYDYTNAISNLKPNVETKIAILRNASRLELIIVPSTR